MSQVVRLQFLPAIADSSDIRQFFCGLNIPAGCVYITGGKYGEAYIVFATHEDAQKALERTGQHLKDSAVHLTSIKEEVMRRALDVYRIGVNPAACAAPPTPEATPRPLDTRHPSSCSYLYMCGLPLEATRRDIQKFFRSLPVEDVLHLRVINGGRLGKAIIKFSNGGDANEALRFSNRPICLSPVILKPSDEEEWDMNGGDALALRQRSPPRPVKERERSRSRSRSPVRRRRARRASPPYVREYFVHLINLSSRVDRKDIKSFFNVHMDDSHISFLHDRDGKRTRQGFAKFTSLKDYRRALEFDKETFKDRTITIAPISKREMEDLIRAMRVRTFRDRRSPPRRSSRERKFLYLRNFPIDVDKANVQKFFTGHTLKEDDIILLYDCRGIALGEALVKYTDEREASKAERENSQTYQGFKIILSRVTEEQMKDLQKGNRVEKAVGSEADDLSGTTSLASVATSGEASVPDSSEVAMGSDSESVSPSNKLSEAPSGSVTPSIPNSPTRQSPTDVNGADETSLKNSPTREANGGSKEAQAPSEYVQATPSMQNSRPQEANGGNKEDEAPSGSEVTPSMQKSPPDGANGDSKEALSEIVQATPSVLSSPDNVNGADRPPPVQNDQDAKDGNEEPTRKDDETKTTGVTLLFVRNLPVSVTATEILDFFQGFKVSSVNLKNIERGEATVRMSNYVDAQSAINSLNKREVGQKTVLLSLT